MHSIYMILVIIHSIISPNTGVTNHLIAGETLHSCPDFSDHPLPVNIVGDALWSKNNQYMAIMQHDCNFVIYSISSFINQRGWQISPKAVWNTNTRTRSNDCNCRLTLQKSDGNMVLYRNENGNWEVLWATNKYGGDELKMQNDGNLVVYDDNNGGRALWASK